MQRALRARMIPTAMAVKANKSQFLQLKPIQIQSNEHSCPNRRNVFKVFYNKSNEHKIELKSYQKRDCSSDWSDSD